MCCYNVNNLKAATTAYAKSIEDGDIVESARELQKRFCADRPRVLLDSAILLTVEGCCDYEGHFAAARSLIARALFHVVQYGYCEREREDALKILKPYLVG